MTYPLNELAIITPIIFFVLLFAFPIIGVFGGWKRAAYWGGGNFINYITGLIIWRTAGFSISNNFIPLVKSLLPESAKSGDIATLVNSVVSPVFFLIVLLISNLALLICYYAFAKKLIGIGKYDKDKLPKAKDGAKQAQVKAQTKSGTVKLYNKKWFNMVVGGVGLTALMLPITLSTTHAVAMTTTSVDTRKTNSLASGLYGGLQETSGTWHWFSFYTGKRAGNDLNFLFSSLAVSQKKITIDGREVTGVQAVTEVLPDAVSNLTQDINDIGKIDDIEKLEDTQTACNEFTGKVNTIISGLGTENLTAMIDSDGGQELVSSLLDGGTVKVSPEEIRTQIADENSVINLVSKAVENPVEGKYEVEVQGVGTLKVDAIQEQIPISQSSYDKLLNTAVEMFEATEEPTDKAQFEQDKKALADAMLKALLIVK